MKPAVLLRNLPGERLGERGVAVVEFAIVLPILLLFMFGLIDFGRAAWTQTTLNYAAQATARCYAIGSSSCSTTALAQAYAVTQAYAITLSCSAGTGSKCVVLSTCTIGSTSGKQAEVSTNFHYFTPLLSHFSGPLTGTACYPT